MISIVQTSGDFKHFVQISLAPNKQNQLIERVSINNCVLLRKEALSSAHYDVKSQFKFLGTSISPNTMLCCFQFEQNFSFARATECKSVS